ncbi:MAG TPA: heme ABC exporter ATP-binding protein CcmA [Rhizomicrobium sp.]|jgi:heme exporter protein A
MTLHALTVDRLTCIRGGRLVFRDLSFELAHGQALALEGANGAGKTSLLRMLAGFLAPVAGKVVLHQDDTQIAEGETRAKRIGWLGHLDAAKPQMRVGEVLQFFARFYDASASESDITAALEVVGLVRLADLPCQYLSAGQKKRLALARLRLCARPLWLMDEPLAALDAAGKTLAAAMISAHCKDGGMAVIATHEPLGIASERLPLSGAG